MLQHLKGDGKKLRSILVTNIRVSHLAAQAPHVDGKVITCHTKAEHNRYNTWSHREMEKACNLHVTENNCHTSSGVEYRNKFSAISALLTWAIARWPAAAPIDPCGSLFIWSDIFFTSSIDSSSQDSPNCDESTR